MRLKYRVTDPATDIAVSFSTYSRANIYAHRCGATEIIEVVRSGREVVWGLAELPYGWEL